MCVLYTHYPAGHPQPCTDKQCSCAHSMMTHRQHTRSRATGCTRMILVSAAYTILCVQYVQPQLLSHSVCKRGTQISAGRIGVYCASTFSALVMVVRVLFATRSHTHARLYSVPVHCLLFWLTRGECLRWIINTPITINGYTPL